MKQQDKTGKFFIVLKIFIFIIKPLKASKKLIRLLWGGKIRRHPAALTIILKPTVMIEWVQELINHISRLINDNETKFQAKAGLKI